MVGLIMLVRTSVVLQTNPNSQDHDHSYRDQDAVREVQQASPITSFASFLVLA